MQQKNQLLFFVLAFLFLIGYFSLRNRLFPPPKPPVPEAALEEKDKGKDEGPRKGEAGKKEEGPKKDEVARKPAAADEGKIPEPRPVTPDNELIILGSDAPDSPFHIRFVIDPLGAAARSLTLNKFRQADDHGRPLTDEFGRPLDTPLQLVPDAANRWQPSFLLLHFDVNDPNATSPLDTLGKVRWKVVNQRTEGPTQFVSFQTDVQGVRVTKTFTLSEKEYHVGLAVQVERAPGAKDRGELQFRYQLTGAHGLPVEGKYYTSTFRNALIGQIQDRSFLRDLQDLRQISVWEGGKEIRRAGGENDLIRYAGVAVQFFASVIAVDNDQKVQNFLSRARPTLETSVSKGRVLSVSANRTWFTLAIPERPDEKVYLIDPEVRQKFLDNYREGSPLAVTHYTDDTGALVALDVGDSEQTQPLWVDDITARVATEPIDLKSDPVVHKYLLYNGPVKVRLLGQMRGVEAVAPELVERYENQLNLNTLTDYQSQGFFGRFASTIGWTWLLIACTNLMHWILGLLHSVVPSFGLCIILLTVLVRLTIFPISRKQAATSLRMQALAPELKKLQEKYKDDRQALGVAQMELYRKHGVNPFGTCWFLLLQMPILMGLYFALQESIFFRLAPFWPTWIINLAAPDMLIRWGENIPWISQPQAYGGFLYLGPYFNLLPVIAVALMIAQQKMLTPPPTDEQQEMQQKIMKYMMVFFGLMFYKVAAGLCVYFIASSAWGFAERKLLPKLKPVTDDTSADSLLKKMLPASGSTAGGASTAVTPAPDGKGRKGKKKRPERAGKPGAAPAEPERTGSGSPIARLRKRIHDWWQDLLEQAEKKAR